MFDLFLVHPGFNALPQQRLGARIKRLFARDDLSGALCFTSVALQTNVTVSRASLECLAFIPPEVWK